MCVCPRADWKSDWIRGWPSAVYVAGYENEHFYDYLGYI